MSRARSVARKLVLATLVAGLAVWGSSGRAAERETLDLSTFDPRQTVIAAELLQVEQPELPTMEMVPPESEGEVAQQWDGPYNLGHPAPCPRRFQRVRTLLSPPGVFPWSERTPEEHRFVGNGQPLMGSSWLNRPFYIDALVGWADGDRLKPGRVNQHPAFMGGYRFGWDYDYYWGTELRFAEAHFPLTDPTRKRNGTESDFFAADLNLLYYPWGDARWRPFVFMGLGTQYNHFIEDNSANSGHHAALWAMPFGIGLKYKWDDWIALRLDLTDNLAFGNGTFHTMNTVSVIGAIEASFGGSRPSFWPWNPSRHLH